MEKILINFFKRKLIFYIKGELIREISREISREVMREILPEKVELLEASYVASKRLKQVLEHLHPLNAAKIVLDETEIPNSVVISEICKCCGYRFFSEKGT